MPVHPYHNVPWQKQQGSSLASSLNVEQLSDRQGQLYVELQQMAPTLYTSGKISFVDALVKFHDDYLKSSQVQEFTKLRLFGKSELTKTDPNIEPMTHIVGVLIFFFCLSVYIYQVHLSVV